jgi:integrase
MASIYKRGKKWYCQYKDENGNWKVEVGYSEKSLSLKKANELEFEAEQRRRGWGDAFADSKAIALYDHLSAFERSLHGRSSDHVTRTIKKIKAFGFGGIDELNSSTATDTVNKLLGTLGASTANHYLTAIQSFCRWLGTNGRMPKTPILAIKKQFIPEQSPEDGRRAATDKEIKRLLKSIKGESYGLSAEQRYYVYQTALNTGFRAKELSSLLPPDFRLAGQQPTIRVKATNTKNKKVANQPINPVFAQMLSGWIKTHPMPTERVWQGNWWQRAAEMLAVDLKAAKIEIETADGILDFHALRTTYITNLIRAGLHPKMVQTLARHSDINLTMKVYARLGIDAIACSMGVVKPVSAPVPLSTNRVRRSRSKTA